MREKIDKFDWSISVQLVDGGYCLKAFIYGDIKINTDNIF